MIQVGKVTSDRHVSPMVTPKTGQKSANEATKVFLMGAAWRTKGDQALQDHRPLVVWVCSFNSWPSIWVCAYAWGYLPPNHPKLLNFHREPNRVGLHLGCSLCWQTAIVAMKSLLATSHNERSCYIVGTSIMGTTVLYTRKYYVPPIDQPANQPPHPLVSQHWHV